VTYSALLIDTRLGGAAIDPAFSGIPPRSTRALRFETLRLALKRYCESLYKNTKKKQKTMFDIVQMESDFESVIDSKETRAEAQEYVSALNDTKKNQFTEFYYKESNLSANESELF
jgi:hypothetical protein